MPFFLDKTQENKNRLLQESNIVKTRLNIILEGKTFKKRNCNWLGLVDNNLFGFIGYLRGNRLSWFID